MTWYLTVRPDDHYGGSVPTCVLVSHLDAVPGLLRTDGSSYRTEGGPDRIHLILAACDGSGSYAAHPDRVPQRLNAVELVCSSAAPGSAYRTAVALAVGIADRLGWEVVDAESEELVHTGPAVPVPARCAVKCPACAPP
ncbi:hypothetical protein ACFW1A_24940 [Kitasatospora sp. NPDC058965]|uniref:hypothetical protein n=1 Tax=Kitasatospora sp. NPDC058965 TaxID=3346682 RepID=UPI003685E28A